VSTAASGDFLSAVLRREGHARRFQRGQALFTEGDRAERVFLIERGWVTVTSAAPDGREIVLGLRGPGDMLGELSALDGEPRSATAVTLSDVEAIDVSASRELIRMLATRLRDADRKRLEFAALDTLGRIAWRLLELSERFGHQTEEGISVELPLSQEQLAAWCGASRESTVKALTSLRGLGCITTGRRHVVIRDLEGLRLHARGIAN
jgi:CRP-like cAMP-binding protein